MKLLLKLLYLLILFIVIILLAGLILPDYASTKKEILVDAKPGLVYEQLCKIENWKTWAPWLQGDKIEDVRMVSFPGGIGSYVTWQNSDYGPGSIKLTSFRENEAVQGIMETGKLGKVDFKVSLRRKNNKTLITYELNSRDIGFLERYFVYFMRSRFGMKHDEFLAALKRDTDRLRLCRMSEPRETVLGPMHLFAIIDTSRSAYYYQQHKNNLERLSAFLERRKIEITGEPLALFYPQAVDSFHVFASAYPVEKEAREGREFRNILIDTTRIASVTHYGDYSKSEPYLELERYLHQMNETIDTFRWEVFVRDPLSEPDTSEWQKQIFIPIKDE